MEETQIRDDPVIEAYRTAMQAVERARLDALATLVAVIRSQPAAVERIENLGTLYPRMAWNEANTRDPESEYKTTDLMTTLTTWALSGAQADLLTPELVYAVSVCHKMRAEL